MVPIDAIPCCGNGLTRDEILMKTHWKMGRMRNALAELRGEQVVSRTGSGSRGDPYRYMRIEAGPPAGIVDLDKPLPKTYSHADLESRLQPCESPFDNFTDLAALDVDEPCL